MIAAHTIPFRVVKPRATTNFFKTFNLNSFLHSKAPAKRRVTVKKRAAKRRRRRYRAAARRRKKSIFSSIDDDFDAMMDDEQDRKDREKIRKLDAQIKALDAVANKGRSRSPRTRVPPARTRLLTIGPATRMSPL